MPHHYHINIFWYEPDDCWIADVPDLPGCSAHGSTPVEAATEAEVAIGLWLDVARQYGDVIPEARYRPTIYAARAA